MYACTYAGCNLATDKIIYIPFEAEVEQEAAMKAYVRIPHLPRYSEYALYARGKEATDPILKLWFS